MSGTEDCNGKLERCNKERADLNNWYLRTVKLAAAVAVIKSKPPGRSGRQQAEYLTAKLKAQDQAWKTKAQSLQEEVLHLRQELFLSKVRSKTSSGDGTGDDCIDPLSLEPGGSTNNTQHTWEKDSGCETEENSEVLPPAPYPGDLALVDPVRQTWSCFPPKYGTQERTVLLHMQFLQNVVGLARLENKDFADGEFSIVPDSISQLLSGMVSVWRDLRPLPSTPLLLQAARVAARAADCRMSDKPLSADVVAQVEDSLKELIDLLLSNSQLNRFHMQEALAESLTLLGGSSLLKPVLIGHILHQINCLANQLWEMCQQAEGEGSKQFNIGKYENSFYLLWVLEQLSVGDAGMSREGRSHELQLLESLALRLSGEFPLFALYAWRVAVHQSSAETDLAQASNAT
ncbi:hypothetical protein GJAV_G00119650 [Gymnothorax javanicus]|nr:hypothetical protein GJAV_G00119650 [Gymnothorax javanicus]